MKHYFLFSLCAALLFALNGCALDEGPSSGGSIAPSASSGGSIAPSGTSRGSIGTNR